MRRMCRTFATTSTLGPLKNQGVLVYKSASLGRGLCAVEDTPEGGVVLAESSPLTWVSASSSLGAVCEECMRGLPLPPASSSPVSCPGCSARYCSQACRARHWEHSGHSVLCGGEAELNAWCKAQGYNFPRMAAYLVAKGLGGGVDYSAHWEAVHSLCYANPPPLDELPRAYREGYDLVRGAFIKGGRVGGNITLFFDSVFNQAAYARLMGTLRLNTFSVACPMDGAGSKVVVASAVNSVEGVEAAGSSCGPALPSNGEGCCGTSSGCGGGSSPTALGDAPGGAALYHLASLANHQCEPSTDVVIAPGGGLALRARLPLQKGDPVTITYLDSSLPLELRRKKLQAGYGFTCTCPRCTRGD
jgi:hypothetical protein